MLNAGVIHRVGAHRLHVKLARSLAAMGYGSVRFDFSGLGDSTLPPDAQDFRSQAQRDVHTVLEALVQQTQVERFALLGICSGAAYAQAAALADPRVKGVFLVDGFIYPWSTDSSIPAGVDAPVLRGAWSASMDGVCSHRSCFARPSGRCGLLNVTRARP
ncbi:MAG: alpha/beta fold hydrolase [Rubrivivax sp.]|nr:alpha/beta fold hydrolase [Rubrivivax sp.]